MDSTTEASIGATTYRTPLTRTDSDVERVQSNGDTVHPPWVVSAGGLEGGGVRAQTMGREQGYIAALWAVAGGEARQAAHGVGRRCAQSRAGRRFRGGFGQLVGRGVG
ncbi:hypothetical protein ACUV84_040427 [Puccinellia chinampoensis]